MRKRFDRDGHAATVMDVARLIVLDRGRVVADGPHHGLLAQGGLYAELWQRQSGGFNPDLKPNYGAEDGCRHAFANNRAVSLNWGRLGTIPRSPRPNLGSGSATIHPWTLKQPARLARHSRLVRGRTHAYAHGYETRSLTPDPP